MSLLPLFLYYVCICLLLSLYVRASEDYITSTRIVALGDLHGDIFQCRRILQLANIIDLKDRWIAGSSIVVQLGDIADRGQRPHEIYDLFASLEEQAKAAGGEFTFVVGNHELMNMLGIFLYVNPYTMAYFGGKDQYAAAFSPHGRYGSYILRHSVCVVREGVVFVHAGIRPAYATLGVDKINEMLRNGFLDHDKIPHMENKGGNEELHRLNVVGSPLWDRTTIREAQSGNCGLVTESLRLLSESEIAAGRLPVHIMVVGHTMRLDGAVSVGCDGRLVGADVGLSRFMGEYGGNWAYVEFVRDKTNPKRRIPVPKYPFGKNGRPSKALLFGRTVRLPPPLEGNSRQQNQKQNGKLMGEVSIFEIDNLMLGYFIIFCVAVFCVLLCVLRVRQRRLRRGHHEVLRGGRD